ncbi:hypothetical protein ABBQ38_009264 [Trebouxia sp. C0009 RCD-2024]
MPRTLGPVALKLGDQELVKVRANTPITDLLEQLDKAYKGARFQDVEGFDVTAHYSEDLPEGEYAIRQPTAGPGDHEVTLLYECYNDESLHGGGDNVVLKFLPSKHPFARLLLREGSRQRKTKVAYELDLWRRSEAVIYWDDEAAGPSYFASSGPIKFCRQNVIWSSEYGRPLEAHLNLCQSIEAWLKTQPVATFGQEDFPKTVVGMVRLDSDERGFTDIQQDIRDSQRLAYGNQDSDEGNWQGTDASKKLDEEQSLDVNSIASASDISALKFQACRGLKETILSLSEAEVTEILADFCKTQAHHQTSVFKSELMAHFVTG